MSPASALGGSMMHKVDDLESAAACDAMVASIRRGLLVAVVMVAAVAIVIPVLGRPPRLAASTATVFLYAAK